MLFLTGKPAFYERVLERAAYLRAIRQILQEFKQQGVSDTDPQLIEAQKIREREESQFYLACRETFQQLYYPARNGLVPIELDPKYVANKYEGEHQIVAALTEVHKYREDATADSPSFRQSLENRLWPEGQQEVLWSEIKRRAAADPAWVLHHPRALDDLKTELVRRDIWRDSGNGYVQRGPFPKPCTDVQVQQVQRDPDTGAVILRVRPLHADIVYYSTEGRATTSSPRLDGTELKTDALRVSFLAVDSTGEHETGEPRDWTNTVEVKYRLYQQGERRMCELRAVPRGEIRYTTDGSSPGVAGQAYAGPFVIPPGTRRILAVARADGLTSDTLRVDVPDKDVPVVSVDRQRPALWKRRLSRDDTAETYRFLDLAGRYRALLCGVRVAVAKEQRWADCAVDRETQLSPQRVAELAKVLTDLIPGGRVSLDVEAVAVEQGQDLLDLVAELRMELKPDEVVQR